MYLKVEKYERNRVRCTQVTELAYELNEAGINIR